ncbi:dipeptide ABC transporter ATP-binding protein [Salinactinospora qingdaonensis]|uniref:ABC transporter ATP-binding protein n=1 Tax=Salinactinospora qingdaonensis TaxID=702744 RepID=A0ABP7EVR1_9ACTN
MPDSNAHPRPDQDDTRPPHPHHGDRAPVLDVTDLRVTFPRPAPAPDMAVLRGLDYALYRGEVLGIVGESGSGKSVAALATMGLLPDHATVSGSVRLNGQQLLGLDERTMATKRGSAISMVFQDPMTALTPIHTIGEHITEAVRTHHPDLGRHSATDRAIRLLELVGVPDAARRSRTFPHECSGGMRQRVMIAIAIANNPDVIICDEPTTALDPTIQAQILETLKTVRRETGAAILIISHDLGVIAGLADRVLVMYAGRAVESGTVDEVYYHSRMPYTMGLLASAPNTTTPHRAALSPIPGTPPSPAALPPGCPFSPRCPIAVDECATGEPQLLPTAAPTHRAACLRASHIAAHGWSDIDLYPPPATGPSHPAAPPRSQRPTVLGVDNLTKHHPLRGPTALSRRSGTIRAIDNVSFDIRERETLALVGESGCGKTSTLMEILELHPPEQGRITALGEDTAALSRRQRFALRRDLQVVFQDPTASLDPRMPVFDLIAEPLRIHRRPTAQVAPRVRELLALVDLPPDLAPRHPRELSGGQRQRVAIARALALNPKLLLLDEPLSALDTSVQAGVINLLTRLQRQLALSYLFVAHDLAVIRHVADRIAVMYLGALVELGTATAVYTRPAHPYTRALLSAVPMADPNRERTRSRLLLIGDPPSPTHLPTGCRFRPRCPLFATLTEPQRAPCRTTEPPMTSLHDDDHATACHYPQPSPAT